MAYKSKFTGLQIDNILDSVEGKQNEIEDLESIRSGAAKGATALQSYTEQYKGTITGVSANGTSVATSGVANIPAASTSKYGVTKLSSATNSTSTSLAATSSAVKTAYDLANGKQDKLVSGTNIKTINGTSILGSGNITIEGGASAYVTDFTILDLYNWAGYQGQHEVDKAGLENALANNIPIFVPIGSSDGGFSGYEILNGYKEDLLYLWVSDNIYYLSNGAFFIEANLSETDSYFEGSAITKITFQNKLVSGTNIKTVNGESILGSGNITIEGGSGGGSGAYSEVSHGTSDTTFTLTPNTFHVWDEVTSLTLDFGSETSGVANEFLFQFTSGSTATSLTLPDDIKWANDEAPTIAENMIYQVSILKGLASVLAFDNEKSIFPMYLTTVEGPTNYRDADELSIALSDYILSKYVSDGTTNSCSIPSDSLFIDGHEVSHFNAIGTAVFDWYFSDGYDYGYLSPVHYLITTGDEKGRMYRFDDD